MSDTNRLEYALSAGLPLPENGTVLVIRPEPSHDWVPLLGDRMIAVQGFKPDHDALLAMNIESARQDTGTHDAAIVCLTKARAENLSNIAKAWDSLNPNGVLLITGPKTFGVDSLRKLIAQHFAIEDVIAKSHGKLIWLRKVAERPTVLDAWLTDAELSTNKDGFITAPGMFSPDGIDAGSRLLATVFDDNIKGRVADLGAGWGWLSAAVLEACPRVAELDMYEAEALAVAAARQNVKDPRVQAHWLDINTLKRKEPFYDWVICNPPFHQGRGAEPKIGQNFIAAAARIIKPSGTALFVANRNLPYEATLETFFRNWDEIPSDGPFKLLRARKPRNDRSTAALHG